MSEPKDDKKDPRIELLSNMMWNGKLHMSQFDMFKREDRVAAARWLIDELEKAQR